MEQNLISMAGAQSSKEDDIDDSYERLESRLKVTHLLDRVTYTAPVNFTEAANTSRHRWFPYKEGFSPAFVREILTRFMPGTSRGLILDPFSGVGTTILEGARLGHDGVGLDVSPLACFVASTKCLRPDAMAIEQVRKDLVLFTASSLKDIVATPENKTVVSYFEPDYLEALLRVKAFALGRPNPISAALFKLAFLSVVEEFSTHRKAGNGLKRKTRFKYRNQLLRPVDQVQAAVGSLIHSYLVDIEKTELPGSCEFRAESSLEALFEDVKFDCVLTSPPYANCFDYSKIYLCELWFGDFFTSDQSQRQFRGQSMRSHVHARWPQRFQDKGSDVVDSLVMPFLRGRDLWSTAIPGMLSGYFADLGQLLHNIYPHLRTGAQLGFVVSNSAYGGVPIATDLLLGEVASKLGYLPKEIVVYRRIIPSSQQFVRISDQKFLRESLVILQKQ